MLIVVSDNCVMIPIRPESLQEKAAMLQASPSKHGHTDGHRHHHHESLQSGPRGIHSGG